MFRITSGVVEGEGEVLGYVAMIRVRIRIRIKDKCRVREWL